MFTLQQYDREVIELLGDFVPERVFDTHVHLHDASTIPNQYHPNGAFYRDYGTVEAYIADMGPFLQNVKTLKLNIMPMPDWAMNDRSNGLRVKANAHVLNQLAKHPECVGSAYVMHGDDAEQIYQMATAPGIGALKCYCFSAEHMDHEWCTIGDFLPEEAWEVAHQLGIPIILHMMRPAALSDADNFSYITRMTHRYSNAKLVLAHCARGFASWTVVDKIRQLEDQGNIWFDMAAVCESPPIAACILKNAAKRTMWGSDYPICMNRGKVVSMGTDFCWFINQQFPKRSSPCFVAAENLMAFRQACVMLDLDKTQIEDLFYWNAMELFKGKDRLI